jgi:phosphatidylglycerophosphate synthase
MATLPYDQRLARILVRPLSRTPITPNQITAITLLLAVAAGVLFAGGDPIQANWAAGIFVLARFLDHFDGELARLRGVSSRFGYYFDYAVGGLGYSALFLGLGIGFYGSVLGYWSLALGLIGAAAAIISMFLNLNIDKTTADKSDTLDAVGYAAFGGFELEDGIYLIAPITWLGHLMPFFVLAGIGAAIYCLLTLWSLVRLRSS